MTLTGRGCGHQYRADVPFCVVCGAARPEPESGPSGEPGPPRWGSPEFLAQTIDARNFQAAPAGPATSRGPAPAGPVTSRGPAPAGPVTSRGPAPVALYQPPAAPVVPGRVLPGPAGPPPGRPRRLRGVLVGLATFLAAGGITAAVMLIAHPLHRGVAAPPAGSAPAPAAGPSGPAAQPASQAAAQGLAGLLARSVMDRSSIVAAVSDVSRCGPNLHQDPLTFQSAVASRQALLTRLAGLPGRSALPAPMLAALSSAWQNSIKADRDFARWAKDEVSDGCTASNQSSDPNSQAAAGPDAQATTAKQSFAGLWNPIATRYGLPAYQWTQL